MGDIGLLIITVMLTFIFCVFCFDDRREKPRILAFSKNRAYIRLRVRNFLIALGLLLLCGVIGLHVVKWIGVFIHVGHSGSVGDESSDQQSWTPSDIFGQVDTFGLSGIIFLGLTVALDVVGLVLVVPLVTFAYFRIRWIIDGKPNSFPGSTYVQPKYPNEEDDTPLVELVSSEKKLDIVDNSYEIDIKDIVLEKMIGQGGSNSTVYSAKWMERPVAVKLFPLVMNESMQLKKEEMSKELNMMLKLNHPNCIRFFGVSYGNGKIGFVMELCGSGDIKNYMLGYKKEYGKNCPLVDRYRWLTEISLGMMYLNSKNILHRDLKDFGLSREMGGDASKTFRVGTAKYMAPEISRGDDYEFSADVFSFAIMAFEIITGNFNPYSNIPGYKEKKDQGNIHLKVMNDPNYRPYVDGLKVALWMKTLIKKCYDNEPTERMTFREISQVIKKNSERKGHTIYVRSQTGKVGNEVDCLLKDYSLKGLKRTILKEDSFSGKGEINNVYLEIGKGKRISIEDEEDLFMIEQDSVIVFSTELDENEKVEQQESDAKSESSNDDDDSTSSDESIDLKIEDDEITEDESDSD